jgi:ABC-type proline/glycine betaine transport system permease subunit
MVDGAALRIINIAMDVLSHKVLTFAALLFSFVLACWTMIMPTWERMAMAAFFAIFIYLPCMIVERKSHEN